MNIYEACGLFFAGKSTLDRLGDAHGLHRFSDVDVPWRRLNDEVTKRSCVSEAVSLSDILCIL